MPSFNFSEDIDFESFKTTLTHYGYSIAEIESWPLPERLSVLEENVRTFIQTSLDMRSYCGLLGLQKRFGFKTDAAVRSFFSNLVDKPVLPKPFPNDLFDKIQSTYDLAAAERSLGGEREGISGTSVLATLPFVFGLIRGLSDDEVNSMDSKYRDVILLNFPVPTTLRQFRDDLSRLSTVDFENKYAGCYNGILENLVGNILDSERLLRLIPDATPRPVESPDKIEQRILNLLQMKETVKNLSDRDSDPDSLKKLRFDRK